MEVRAGLLERMKGTDGAFPARPPDREFRDHYRKPQKHEEHEIEQHERRPAVFPRDERKPPHVPQPDCASRARHDEPDS